MIDPGFTPGASVFPDVVKAYQGPIPTDAAVAVHRAILVAMRLGATPSLP